MFYTDDMPIPDAKGPGVARSGRPSGHVTNNLFRNDALMTPRDVKQRDTKESAQLKACEVRCA